MVFHWRLSDSKSHQVSRTLLSILVVFNNAVVWMVSTRLRTSKTSRPFYNPIVTVPKAPITIGINSIFLSQVFLFLAICRSRMRFRQFPVSNTISIFFSFQFSFPSFLVLFIYVLSMTVMGAKISISLFFLLYVVFEV